MSDKRPTKPKERAFRKDKLDRAQKDNPDLPKDFICDILSSASSPSEPFEFRRKGRNAAVQITYDKIADALYISLVKAEPAKQQHVNDDFILDIDSTGRVIGIEILDAKKTYGEGIEPRAGWAEAFEKMHENGDDVVHWDDKTADPRDDDA
ncbi:MAG: DUF2283 domain-containing protein [Negativicutes bacterium]|nr:DUF2283 domain-containing protein [Negativicutes bacterium]